MFCMALGLNAKKPAGKKSLTKANWVAALVDYVLHDLSAEERKALVESVCSPERQHGPHDHITAAAWGHIPDDDDDNRFSRIRREIEEL